MEIDLWLDLKDPQKIDRDFVNRKMAGLLQTAKELLENNIREVYEINSKIRIKGNYVPLEEMLSSIKIEYDPNDYKFTIGVDEELIEWKDSLGEDIYQVETYLTNQKVTEWDEHWRTPIGGTKEDDWFLVKTGEELLALAQPYLVK